MAFHEDPGVREEAPKAAGPRFFFRIIAQEAAALLKLNLLFLLFCLPAVTIPPALLALFQGQEPCHSVPTKAMPDSARFHTNQKGRFHNKSICCSRVVASLQA